MYWCPEKNCKYYKHVMTIEENWKHLKKFHKAHKKPPVYKLLDLTKNNLISK
jgi:hypothetical protein